MQDEIEIITTAFSNLKLNMQKCKVRQKEVRYVGHLLTADGLKPDPSTIEALRNMPIPWNEEDMRRFLGFVAYLAKFIPQLSEVNAPLRASLRADSIFDWQPAQDQAFHKLLDLCCQQPVLSAYYDVKASVEIHADASQSGLGSVLMQEGKPVAYTSRSLSEVEQRYA